MNQKNLDLAIQLRHELHQHPELSNKEVWTKKWLMAFLKEHTSLEVIDKGNWFYAISHAGEGKTNIAFRADFDAVPVQETCDIPYISQNPGIGHKCGHDGHSAALAAFALEVDQNQWDKNIFFLFQHAEETGDGAIQCVEMFKEYVIDEVFAFHNMPGYPKGSVVVREGTMQCASKGMSIFMKGAPAHASMPETGKNPSFAIADIIAKIPGLIRPEDHKGLVLCTVIQVDIGEEAFGVSASEGVLRLTLRGQYEEEMQKLQENIENLAKQHAEEQGLNCRFEFCDSFPETAAHKESVEKIRSVCKIQNLEIIEMEEPIRGSEDFGHYTKLTKGAMFFIGSGFGPQVHTSEYDFPDEIIEEAVEIYKALVQL